MMKCNDCYKRNVSQHTADLTLATDLSVMTPVYHWSSGRRLPALMIPVVFYIIDDHVHVS